MKPAKAILLDAQNNTVSFVSITNYKDISKFGRYDLFTTVQINDKGETLFVDDEGLLNGTDFGFEIEGYPEPIMGNAVILGTNFNTGDSVDTDLTLDDVAKMVRTFQSDGFRLVRNRRRANVA